MCCNCFTCGKPKTIEIVREVAEKLHEMGWLARPENPNCIGLTPDIVVRALKDWAEKYDENA